MSVWPMHADAVRIAAPAGTVFDFMASPAELHRWSFGTWETTLHEDGLVEGRSIFDGSVTWVRIEASRPHLLVDYHLGPSPDALKPRICARVVPAPHVGGAEGESVLTLLAWRDPAMADARWDRLTRAHGFELFLIKSLIETGGPP
jgi:uncharacterized protein YndB with AHSA1/START domain